MSVKSVILKIICYVRTHEKLWRANSSSNSKSELNHKNLLWNNIAEDMNLPVDEVLRKWKSYRDKFRKELSRMKTSNLRITHWPYFPYLLFLSKNMPPILTENIELEDGYEKLYNTKFDIDPDDIDTSVEDFQILVANVDRLVTTEETDDSIKNEDIEYNEVLDDENVEMTSFIDENYVEYEEPAKVKTQVLEVNPVHEDSNYMFLLNLLPFLKNISQKDELMIRIRLLQILNTEELSFNDEKDQTTEVEVLSDFSEFQNDFEYLFLMSLLPFLRIVPQHRKLIVRSKMLELFSINSDEES